MIGKPLEIADAKNVAYSSSSSSSFAFGGKKSAIRILGNMPHCAMLTL